MFTRHRPALTNKLDCPHAMGTDTFSSQRAESFRHCLLLPSPSVVYHERKPTNLRVRLGGVRRSFRLQVYGYVVMPEHVHLLLSEPQGDTSSGRTAQLKPKDGVNGPTRHPSIVDADSASTQSEHVRFIACPVSHAGGKRLEAVE